MRRNSFEISNECIKDCLYCGIRRGNKKVDRFNTPMEDILEAAKWIHKNNFGSLAIQAGERQDREFVDFIEKLLIEIHKATNNELGITISLGEQTHETFERWRKAGGHRYLLRIESSNKEIYKSLHPNDPSHNFEARVACLKSLRDNDFQVGTGVMIGLPNQTEEDLVNDILFYKEIDIDMIGMGPYISHDETPMRKTSVGKIPSVEKRVELALKMIALSRIVLKDVNIAATTALQGLDSQGREKGLKAGANVLMPSATIDCNKSKYTLYDNKPGINDSAEKSRDSLTESVRAIGDEVIFNEQGNSLHYKKRKGLI